MNTVLFHFLRPEWLVTILPFLLLYIWLWRQTGMQSGWRRIISAELAPYLLIDSDQTTRRWPILFIALAGILAIIAMAGPTWERLPKPVFRSDSALVIVLDLSRSMDAKDIKPSRIQRAHFKITDIIKARKEGQTALIVYAGDAFTVTPLTDDGQTIVSQLGALTPDLMPVQGNRADIALELAGNLLKQASQTQGDILLITDEVPATRGLEAARKITRQGYRLSVLGTGTTEGAPIPLRGGMLKDRQGNIIIAKLDNTQLQQIASAGGGHYTTISIDDTDLKQLDVTQTSRLNNSSSQVDGLVSDTWKEFGPWLLLPVLLLAAFSFRRGILILALFVLLPLPQPASAFEWSTTWQNIWQTRDQQAQQLMQQKNPAAAAKIFNHPAWRAGAQYQSGNFENALNDYQSLQGSEARYNEGNTLAKLGELQDALRAYDKSIQLNPDHGDAKHNRKLVEEALKKQQQHRKKQPGDQQPNDSQDQSGQNQSGQDKSQQDQQKDSGSEQDKSSDSRQQSAESSESGSSDKQQTDEQQHDEQNNKGENQQADQSLQTDSPQQAESGDQQANDNEALNNEQKLAREQWLKRIPDDPAGLLRRKFKYQYQQRARQNSGEQTW